MQIKKFDKDDGQVLDQRRKFLPLADSFDRFRDAASGRRFVCFPKFHQFVPRLHSALSARFLAANKARTTSEFCEL
jgi:hypothetical protein